MSFREWKEVRLGDVADYVSDKIETTEINLENYISTENLIADIGGLDMASGLPNVNKVTKFEKNDILISNIRPYFKKIWFASRNGGCSNDVLVLKASNKVDSTYLYYNLACDEFFNYVMSGVKGTKMPRGDKKHILDYLIYLPKLQEQKAIANILSALDEKIEVNNKINKTLEKMSQAIFKQWFVDFEFPNGDGEPYKSSGGEMVESELGMIPMGWEVGNLGDIIDISSGKRPKDKVQDITDEYYIPLVGASSIMGYVKEYNYNEPILIIGRVGTHGVVQRFNEGVWASDNTLVIKSIYYEYVYQVLNTIDYNSLNRGSTQPLITQTDIKKQNILIPNRRILNKYERLVKNLFNTVINNKLQNLKLANIRDTLLPKLMSGEIRVPLNE